jgi:ABC-type molybdate transport system substrate-binding protein
MMLKLKTLLLVICALCLSVMTTAHAYASKDGKSHDYRTFTIDKSVQYGRIADSYTADLVMYLAGNQFMVMEELVRDFQAKNPDIRSVYVSTIPPGQILKEQILQQGSIGGQKTSMTPDLFASVNLGHLVKLRERGKMDQYMIYTHNKLELMVAKGNPKNITGPKDLTRDDLVQSHPNPVTEGIFKFYGSQMLNDLGIYEEVTGGAMCKGCWAVPKKTWFTTRHHRETPYRIENNLADVGIVWTTEVVEGKKRGRAIEGVSIAAPYNMAHKVGYAIGVLSDARNKVNAQRFIDYLATNDAQDIYASYGFVRAMKKELVLRPIPLTGNETKVGSVK